MNKQTSSFALLFKQYRLRAGFATLSDFGDALAQGGFVYENSLFSHWQKGSRIPKERELLIAIINTFIKHNGISSIEEANALFASVGQRDLDKQELVLLSKDFIGHASFTVPNQSERFIGREKHIVEIGWHLLNNKPVLIHGKAGVGKTYLAIRIGHILKDKFSGGVLWYRFDIQGVDNILNDIARIFNEDISRIGDQATRYEIIKSLLSKKNVLLILDNIESFDELTSFFPDKDMPYSLLMTSKLIHDLPAKAKRIGLNDFNKKELLNLAKQLLGTPFVLMNREKIMQLGGLIGYSPLAATVLLRRIEYAPKKLQFFLDHFEKELANVYTESYDDKTLNRSLSFTVGALPKKITNFFVSLGVFSGADFSADAAAAINDISRKDAKLKLDYLYTFSLVEYSAGERWRLHPLIKLFIKDNKQKKRICERMASYYVYFLQTLERGNLSCYDTIENEFDNIIGVFGQCYARGFYQKAIELWEYIGVFLWDTGRWSDLEKYGLMMVTASTKLPDKHALATCYIRELCWLYYWQGDIDKAKRYVEAGVEIAEELEDPSLLSLGWIRFGKICQSKRWCAKALRFFSKALVYFIKKQDTEKQGDIYTYIGETYWLEGKNERAKQYLHRALKITNAIGDIPQKTTILSRLGCIELQEKSVKRAISYFNKSWLLRKQSGRRSGDTFWNNLALGLAYAMQGNAQLANEKFKQAKYEMTRGGYTERILHVDVFPLMFTKELKEYGFL